MSRQNDEWPAHHIPQSEPPAPPFPKPPVPAMGCICPPGANKDCENPLCPRKNQLARLRRMGGTDSAP